jgi:hypothetical protein
MGLPCCSALTILLHPARYKNMTAARRQCICRINFSSCEFARLISESGSPAEPSATIEDSIMTSGASSWNAIMQYSFLRVFANNGTIDADELVMLERLAMEDGTMDDRERTVLSNIFSRVSAESVSGEVWEGITQFKLRHDIP